MSDSLTFKGGLTLSVPVANLDAAIAWYQDVLGFEMLYRKDEIGWCELRSPVDQVNVGLSVVERPQPGGVTPTFGVSDIDSSKDYLAGKDVRIDGDVLVIPDLVKLLTFYDLDGNALMLFEVPQEDV